MSHFMVVVRLPGTVAEDDVETEVERMLAPFHEFECTGEDDEFVQNVDRTEEVRAAISDRKDKTGTVAEYVEGYYGWKPVLGDAKIDIQSTHKYGWARFTEAGELVEAFDRTNPNKKWDWWTIGGRWSGYFPVRHSGASVESTIDADYRAAQEELERFTKSRTGAEGEHEKYLELHHRLDTLGKLAYVRRRRQAGIRLGRAGTFKNVPELAHSDYVRKGEIDWDLVATKTRESIEAFHAEWERFIAGEKFGPFEGPDDKARRIGLLETRQGPPRPGEEDRAIPWSKLVPPGDDRASWNYVYTRISLDELFAKYADAFSPIAGYAYLDETGWHEPGKMGWFGCSSDTPETLLANKQSFTRWLKETPDDAWLVAVDCHI